MTQHIVYFRFQSIEEILNEKVRWTINIQKHEYHKHLKLFIRQENSYLTKLMKHIYEHDLNKLRSE